MENLVYLIMVRWMSKKSPSFECHWRKTCEVEKRLIFKMVPYDKLVKKGLIETCWSVNFTFENDSLKLLILILHFSPFTFGREVFLVFLVSCWKDDGCKSWHNKFQVNKWKEDK